MQWMPGLPLPLLASCFMAAALLHICLMCSSVRPAHLLALCDCCAAGKVEGDQEAFGPSPAVRILQQNTRLGELLIYLLSLQDLQLFQQHCPCACLLASLSACGRRASQDWQHCRKGDSIRLTIPPTPPAWVAMRCLFAVIIALEVVRDMGLPTDVPLRQPPPPSGALEEGASEEQEQEEPESGSGSAQQQAPHRAMPGFMLACDAGESPTAD